ncbi:Spastin [Hordeum vulgare]|nr:Spastin [Hordeum vulgare]
MPGKRSHERCFLVAYKCLQPASPPWSLQPTLAYMYNQYSEQTKEVLISAAFVHLKQAGLSKHIQNLSAASRAILLSGPTEAYLQSLAKALSHYYKARLLLLDVTDYKGTGDVGARRAAPGQSGALGRGTPWSKTGFARTGGTTKKKAIMRYDFLYGVSYAQGNFAT